MLTHLSANAIGLNKNWIKNEFFSCKTNIYSKSKGLILWQLIHLPMVFAMFWGGALYCWQHQLRQSPRYPSGTGVIRPDFPEPKEWLYSGSKTNTWWVEVPPISCFWRWRQKRCWNKSKANGKFSYKYWSQDLKSWDQYIAFLRDDFFKKR